MLRTTILAVSLALAAPVAAQEQIPGPPEVVAATAGDAARPLVLQAVVVGGLLAFAFLFIRD